MITTRAISRTAAMAPTTPLAARRLESLLLALSAEINKKKNT